MLTRSQTRMNSKPGVMPYPKDISKPKPKETPKPDPKPVVKQERMTTRSQARQVEEDEAEVITLHVNPSKNRRIIPDDTDINNVIITPRRSSRISINFDEASKAWRSNKRSVGNGQFEYVM
jgi:hypothetical protein